MKLGVLSDSHDRMPAIVPPDDYALWLNPETKPQTVAEILRPFETEELESFPVSKQVNSPTHDFAEIVSPARGE